MIEVSSDVVRCAMLLFPVVGSEVFALTFLRNLRRVVLFGRPQQSVTITSLQSVVQAKVGKSTISTDFTQLKRFFSKHQLRFLFRVTANLTTC